MAGETWKSHKITTRDRDLERDDFDQLTEYFDQLTEQGAEIDRRAEAQVS